jgi:hypothetical protein
MTIGKRIIAFCVEVTATAANDKFIDVEDLIDRMCHVCIIFLC